MFDTQHNLSMYSFELEIVVYSEQCILCIHYMLFRSNVLETDNKSYLKTCRYDEELHPYCPIFRLGDITKRAGFNIRDMYTNVSIMPRNSSIWEQQTTVKAPHIYITTVKKYQEHVIMFVLWGTRRMRCIFFYLFTSN